MFLILLAPSSAASWKTSGQPCGRTPQRLHTHCVAWLAKLYLWFCTPPASTSDLAGTRSGNKGSAAVTTSQFSHKCLRLHLTMILSKFFTSSKTAPPDARSLRGVCWWGLRGLCWWGYWFGSCREGKGLLPLLREFSRHLLQMHLVPVVPWRFRRHHHFLLQIGSQIVGWSGFAMLVLLAVVFAWWTVSDCKPAVDSMLATAAGSGNDCALRGLSFAGARY